MARPRSATLETVKAARDQLRAQNMKIDRYAVANLVGGRPANCERFLLELEEMETGGTIQRAEPPPAPRDDNEFGASLSAVRTAAEQMVAGFEGALAGLVAQERQRAAEALERERAAREQEVAALRAAADEQAVRNAEQLREARESRTSVLKDAIEAEDGLGQLEERLEETGAENSRLQQRMGELEAELHHLGAELSVAHAALEEAKARAGEAALLRELVAVERERTADALRRSTSAEEELRRLLRQTMVAGRETEEPMASLGGEKPAASSMEGASQGTGRHRGGQAGRSAGGRRGGRSETDGPGQEEARPDPQLQPVDAHPHLPFGVSAPPA